MQGTEGDILYVKINEDRVEVYTDISKDRSIRKQIILNTPNEEMLRLYSNNKETATQMSRMLTSYEADNKNINGIVLLPIWISLKSWKTVRKFIVFGL